MSPRSQHSIRRAKLEESALLSDLALRSKGSWGYPREMLESMRQELTYSPEVLEEHPAFVVEMDGKVAGFYTLEPIAAGESRADDGVELGALFIEPHRQRSGLGRLLLEHAAAEARRLGYAVLVIQGDPNAGDFYQRMGAIPAGTRPSGSIPGRELPMFHLDLESSEA
ncbi:MAG: GNAT family N-acetyltransferase [Acidobacteriota bacterium]|nr:GNAT family N-acetyltransferase [Acidobacteriota bacterium]